MKNMKKLLPLGLRLNFSISVARPKITQKLTHTKKAAKKQCRFFEKYKKVYSILKTRDVKRGFHLF